MVCKGFRERALLIDAAVEATLRRAETKVLEHLLQARTPRLRTRQREDDLQVCMCIPVGLQCNALPLGLEWQLILQSVRSTAINWYERPSCKRLS